MVLSLILPLAFVEMLWKGGTQGPTNFFNIFLDVDLQVSPGRIGLSLGIGQLVAGVPPDRHKVVSRLTATMTRPSSQSDARSISASTLASPEAIVVSAG